MAMVRKEIETTASIAQAWDALRDIGALHTRLVPGFVTETKLEEGARLVTFSNGMVVREPIITVDETTRRVVWSVEHEAFTHYNGAAEVLADGKGARIVWTADFLPQDAAEMVDGMMSDGAAAMKKALDRLAAA